jgi:hypothetical protein
MTPSPRFWAFVSATNNETQRASVLPLDGCSEKLASRRFRLGFINRKNLLITQERNLVDIELEIEARGLHARAIDAAVSNTTGMRLYSALGEGAAPGRAMITSP